MSFHSHNEKQRQHSVVQRLVNGEASSSQLRGSPCSRRHPTKHAPACRPSLQQPPQPLSR
jgi:hypothetical protein